jgi:hypothetical protein
MVLCMSRIRYKTVSNNFALLVPANRQTAAGHATFLRDSVLPEPVLVRPVDSNEVKAAARSLGGDQGAEFDALLALRGALEKKDELAIGDAIAKMDEVVYSPRERDLVNSGWSTEFLQSLRPEAKTLKAPARLLSFEISRIVGNLNSNIALWWNQGKFHPAIFCLDMKTALYVHTFFIVPTGGLGFRICPHCQFQFFQDRPNQYYCCPEHGAAHRVKRSRNNRKRNGRTSR